MKPEIWKVAHRGASGEAPENTIISFKKAIAQGADVIETDARLSKDTEIILIHDETVARTTDGRGRVCELTLKELKSFDAGSWFGKDFSNQRLPTLSEAVEIVRGRAKLDIELKGSDPLLPAKVVDLLEKDSFTREAIVSSFNCSFIKEVKRLNPRVITGLLFATSRQERKSFSYWKWADLILPSYNLATRDLVTKAHNNGLKVIVWTVDDPQEIRRLRHLGVDGIASNYPRRLASIL